MPNNRAVLLMNQRSRAREHAQVPASARVRPVDRLLGFYAGIAGVALLFPHRPSYWPLLAVLHLGALFMAVAPGAVGDWLSRHRPPDYLRLLADWYPLLLIPALYKELQVLNVAIFN